MTCANLNMSPKCDTTCKTVNVLGVHSLDKAASGNRDRRRGKSPSEVNLLLEMRKVGGRGGEMFDKRAVYLKEQRYPG